MDRSNAGVGAVMADMVGRLERSAARLTLLAKVLVEDGYVVTGGHVKRWADDETAYVADLRKRLGA
jgi:hypothetical protein